MNLKQSISLLSITSLLVIGGQGSEARTPKVRRLNVTSQQGFCVKAPALPQLAAERGWSPGQGDRHRPVPMRSMSAEVAMAAPSAPVAAPPPPPPAPPPAASAKEAAPADGATGSSSEGRSGYLPLYPDRPQPYPQAGLLTAGEHDDLLNPELYARYVGASDLGQFVRSLPVLDTRAVLTVEVRDDMGRPVPFADVVLTCSDGNRLTVPTLADGRAVFFPGVDRLSPDVRITAQRNGRMLGEERQVRISNGAGGQMVTLSSRQGAQTARKLDLMLVVDTTGSMSDELKFLQTELKSVVNALVQRHPELDVRVGFVFYRDQGDDYVTHTVPFDTRMERLQGALAKQYADGGGDYPEAMDQALIRAVGQDWRPDAIKSLLLVADAPPHDEKVSTTWLASRVAREKRIQITPVAASGVADTAEYAMRAMAALTQSRYLFLTDDSGVGNPHAPPAIDCYLVTRLDAALRRVLDSQISGRRIEPDRTEVIRSVGQYDAGRCILPRDWSGQGAI